MYIFMFFSKKTDPLEFGNQKSSLKTGFSLGLPERKIQQQPKHSKTTRSK